MDTRIYYCSSTSFTMYHVVVMMMVLVSLLNGCKADDACTNSPCQNGGICFLASNPSASIAFICTCPQDFEGPLCETATGSAPSPPVLANTPCSSGPCRNGATCANPTNPLSTTALCQCAPGYVGYTCDRLDTGKGDCDPNPCGDFGTCDPSPFALRGYSCQCIHGYTGANCELSLSGEYNGCGSSPCLNGAQCMNQYETFDYYCDCASGYSGRHCEVEGPCVWKPCLNGGTCQEEAFASIGYICACTSEYFGENCSEAYPSNPCSPSPCINEGSCFQLMESELNQNLAPYFCFCTSGYVGSTCQNIDPCYSSPCMNRGTCTLIAPGGNEDMVQGFWCDCPSDFTGTTCSQPDPCSSNPCLNGATCMTVRDVFDPLFEDGSAGYMCDCDLGWAGINCEEELPIYDACSSDPCLNGAYCTTISSFYTCECAGGFVGSNCELIDPCSSNPCVNDGQCFISAQLDSFICQCDMPFMGQYCEIVYEHPCLSGPCLSGGTCTFDINVYECQCTPGYLGLQCESPDPCFPPQCQNDGVCWRNADATDFLCQCASGYRGIYCEEVLPSGPAPIKYCESNPCEGDSTCELEGPDSSGNFYPMCLCPLGFTGVTCGIELPPTPKCQPNPCLNGGGCTPSPSAHVGYICSCQQGYTGMNCEHTDVQPSDLPTPIETETPTVQTRGEIQPCQSNPCQNDGTCVDNDELFICLCPTFFVGPACATDIRDCSFGGQTFKDGDIRNEGCGECVCDNSEWDCTTNVCECYADGNVYNNEETWYEDCNTCSCQDGITLCTTIDCSSVCLHDGQLYDVGSQRDDRCSTCLCQFGRWYCASLDDCVDNTCMYGSTPYEEGTIRPQHCNLCTCRQNDWQCTTSSCDILKHITVDGDKLRRELGIGFPVVSQVTIELDKAIPEGKESDFKDAFRTGMILTFVIGNTQIQNMEIRPSNGSRVYLQFSIVKNSSEEISVDVITEAIQTKVESGNLELVFEGQTYRAISSTFTEIDIDMTTEKPSDEGKNNMSVIIGAVGGTIGILVIIVCIIAFLYFYSKRKGDKEGNANVPLHLQRFDAATPPESPVSRNERSQTVPAHYRFKTNPYI